MINSATSQTQPSQAEWQIYYEYFNWLKSYPLHHDLKENILSTFMFTHKKNPKCKSELFQMKFALPNLPMVLPLKPAMVCSNIINDRAYICYDCRYKSKAFLCQACFTAGNHQIKCRYQIKQLPPTLHNFYQCCCGYYSKMSFRGTCPGHGKILSQTVCIATEETQKMWSQYIGGCLKLAIVLVLAADQFKTKYPQSEDNENIQSISTYYFRNLFEFLKNTNKNTHEFLLITQQCLLELVNPTAVKYPEGEPCSIMKLIFKAHEKKAHSFIYDCIGELLELENKDLFSCMLEDAVNSEKYTRSSKLSCIKEIRSLIKIRPELFCQLLEQFKQQIQQKDQWQALQLYAFAATPHIYLFNKQKQKYSMISGFESLFKKGFLTIENIVKIKSTSILTVLSNVIYNKYLFVQMIRQLVNYIFVKLEAKYVTKDEVGRKISLSEMCNVLTKLIYMHLGGDWSQAGQFMAELGHDHQLVTIIYYFIFESFGNTSHLSQQTVLCFGTYLSMVQISNQKQYQVYCDLWKNTVLPCQRFIDLMAKVLNILIGQQLKYLSKLSLYREISQQERSKIEKVQQQKFKQLLFMQREIPKKQIEILHKENILNFAKANQILQQFTRYNKQTRTFVYSSKQNCFSYDGIVNAIFHMKEQAQKLVFMPEIEDESFTAGEYKYRRAVVQGLFHPLLQDPIRQVYTSSKLDGKLFKSVTLNHDYVRYVCLVIVDKITQGSIKGLRMSLIGKREQLAKYVKPIQPTDQSIRIQKLQNLFGCSSIQNEQFSMELTNKSEQIKQIDTPIQIFQSTEQAKVQQQVKLESISNEKTEQKSQTSIETPNKSDKLNKLQKLKQKFQLKQASILSAYSSHSPSISKQNADTCMTCKEEGHPNNSLFYLGVLKKQGPENKLFQSVYSCDYSVNLCMHMLHEACYSKLSNGLNLTCPLCKVSSNILFPLEKHPLDEKAIEFLDNRLTYVYIQQFNQYHGDKGFIFLIKNVVSEILLYTIFNVILSSDKQISAKNVSKIQLNKKLDYYLLLLTEWWKAMTKQERELCIVKINKLVQDSLNKMHRKEKDPKTLVDDIAMHLVWAKILQKDNTKQIRLQLTILEQLIDPKEFDYFVAYLQSFMGYSLNYENRLIETSTQKFINHYFNPPVSISILQHETSICSLCKKSGHTNIHYCLYCNFSYCLNCNHEKTHGNIKARINGQNGLFEYSDKKGKCYEARIYLNCWQNVWGTVEYGHDDYFAYEVQQDQMNRALYEWVRELRN